MGTLALLGAGSVHAETPPVWVWYRTSEGCPDGPAFVGRLSALGKDARLARVGDRVDFVVTLGHGASGSSGRLERQTSDGTVAIQEYRDASCEHVAEALALTLDLALEPAAKRAAPPAAPVAAARDVPVAVDDPLAVDGSAAGATSAAPAGAPGAGFSLGAQATLASGVAPAVLPGGALFVALEPSWGLVQVLRATLLAGYRASSAPAGDLDVLLMSARVEGCPLAWRGGSLSLTPCAGVEGGLLRASGAGALGTSDAGLWGSALALGRLGIALGAGVQLEAQAAARLPLVRYEMGSVDGSAAWFQTPPVGVEAGVGMAWQIP